MKFVCPLLFAILMLISQNWLRELVDFSCSPQELADILTMLGIEVEAITDTGSKFDKFFIGEVLQREAHPDADKLSVCQVSTGGDATRTIICGAPNVAAGQKVAVAIEGAIVPNGGFEIGKRKIRGVESNGMICSKFELGTGPDDGGIWELPADAVVGIPLAEYLGATDVVYDISVTPNRADCLSHLGIAREIAAYFQTPLRKPVVQLTESSTSAASLASVEIRNAELCPRYAGRVIAGVQVAESPKWLQDRLTTIGLRPRNNIVDITNLVLMECGHPLHAFDLDTIAGKKIIVQQATNGEKFTTLDSKERVLDSDMLMICDAEKNIAIGGVMGGENSEITNATTTVFLESAYFQPSSVRRTAKKLSISSDASYRFERGADIDNVLYALDRAAALIAELGSGTIAQGVLDVYPAPAQPIELQLRPARAVAIIGVDIPREEMRSLLERLGFAVVNDGGEAFTVRVPTYRVDIGQEIDLIEEIARLYNYNNIPPSLSGSIVFAKDSVPASLAVLPHRVQLQAFLPAAGFHEILTQNMADPASAALFTENPVRLLNPLGEELSILRPSLMPSMLRVMERNMRFGVTNLRLFETGKTFRHAAQGEQAPVANFIEEEELLVGLSGKAQEAHWSGGERSVDFYDIKGVLESVLAELRVDGVRLMPLESDHPVLSRNTIVVMGRGKAIGYAGEVAPAMLKRYDIGQPVYLLSLSLTALHSLKTKVATYAPVSPYPTVKRDLAFVVDKGVQAAKVQSAIAKNAGKYLHDLQVFDVFEGSSLGDNNKSIAFSLAFNSSEKTLLDSDVDTQIQTIVKAVEKATGGKLRG